MKEMNRRPGCGCPSPAIPSAPDWGGKKPAPPPPDMRPPSGRFLMQRILAQGKLHRRRQCYSLCLNCCNAPPPFHLLDATVCGMPRWEELSCHERGAVLLQVTVPLYLRLRDADGCLFTAESSLEEQLRLRISCPDHDFWRGQIFVQAAVRPAGNACTEECGCLNAPLEVLLEGYMLSPCAVGGAPCPPPCPEPKPWYPQPRFDPWQHR